MSYIGKYIGRYVGSYLGAIGAIVATADPPGPTIDALNAGSINRRYVFAIGGYDKLITDAPPAAAIEAWQDTPWEDASALGGLYTYLEHKLSVSPWEPLPVGGRLTVRVAPDSTARTFSRETRRRLGGEETLLLDTVDCNDATLEVQDTTGFTAPGTAYVGTETVHYTGVASSPERLTGVTRGLYAPFGRDGADDFGMPHVVDDDPDGIPIKPEVSSQPRKWIGRWCGLWMHRWDEQNQLLNLKEDARLVFAGRVTSVRDNAKGTTDLECEHALTYFRRAVLGEQLWSATMKEGIFLQEGWVFNLSDSSDFTSGSPNDAQPLVIGAGAPGPYTLPPRRYTFGELVSYINQWFQAALDDGDIAGTYGLTYAGEPGSFRGQFDYELPGSGGKAVFFWTMPEPVWRFLGKFNPSHGVTVANASNMSTFLGRMYAVPAFAAGVPHTSFSDESPLRHLNNTQNAIGDVVIELENERGDFVNQGSSLPAPMQALLGASLFSGDAGVVVFDDSSTALVLKNGDHFSIAIPNVLLGSTDLSNPEFAIPLDAPERPITVRQILVVAEPLRDLMKKLFYSTGTAGYNGTYDSYPRPLALGCPGVLLGDAFEASCDALPGAELITTLIIDKPKKLVDILAGDLKLRLVGLRWKDQGLQFGQWRTPVTSSVLLSDSNKASPAGTQDEQRCTTLEHADWMRNVIKIEFDRDFLINGTENYRRTRLVVNRVSMDDHGRALETIRASNTYSQFTIGGAGIEDLIPHFANAVTMFTEPVTIIERTIDSTMWEQIAVLDEVLVTDKYAMDDEDGDRGIDIAPALVVDHWWNPGGSEPGSKPRPMSGGVKLMVFPVRTGPYVPAADVDNTADGAGYDGDVTLTVLPHAYSVSSEPVDATRFPALSKVRIVERDPIDPAAPLVWEKAIVSQTGNELELDSALGTGMEPAWDDTKRYRVIFQDYTDVVTLQKRYSYQADSDGRVQDERSPFRWTTATHTQAPGIFIAVPNSADDPVELPPDDASGDGVGLDVGTQAAISRTLNNLLDYKTALHNPIMFPAEVGWDGAPDSGWQLVACFPINLSVDGLSNGISRSLFVAPQMKSTNGDSTSVRVTLARRRPSGSTNNDVYRGQTYSQAIFSTNSTTYVTADVDELDIGTVKDGSGDAFLLVEVAFNASLWGLPLIYEGPRA